MSIKSVILVDKQGYMTDRFDVDTDYVFPLEDGQKLIFDDIDIAMYRRTKPRYVGDVWLETATPEEIEEAERKRYDEAGLTYPPKPIIPTKTPTELDAELQQTNSLLGDTILSGWETQAELDLNEQILGDTILSTWEMDERITEIEEKIGGQE